MKIELNGKVVGEFDDVAELTVGTPRGAAAVVGLEENDVIRLKVTKVGTLNPNLEKIERDTRKQYAESRNEGAPEGEGVEDQNHQEDEDENDEGSASTQKPSDTKKKTATKKSD